VNDAKAPGRLRGICGRRRLVTALVSAAALTLSAQAFSGASLAQAQGLIPVPVHDHWMADMAASSGRLQLGQVILPASHDSATYGFSSLIQDGPDGAPYTTVQDIDVYTQLQHGIRVLDLRGKGSTRFGREDYYVFHGNDVSNLPLSTVLDDVNRWVFAPGHEKEVLIVQIAANKDADTDTSTPSRFSQICGQFNQNLGGVMLTPGSFADAHATSQEQRAIALATNPAAAPPVLEFPSLGKGDLAQYTLAEVWSLPQKQRVIVNWPGCVVPFTKEPTTPPTTPTLATTPTSADTWNGYWANQCYAGEYSLAAKLAYAANPMNQFKTPDPATFARPGIVGAVRAALDERLKALGADGQFGKLGAIATQPTTFVAGVGGRKVPLGFYTLGLHATITPECGYPVAWFLSEQAAVLDTVKNWFDSDQNNARNYLNILSADYVEQTKLVDYAIQMNMPAD
jgi:hypothetical protein